MFTLGAQNIFILSGQRVFKSTSAGQEWSATATLAPHAAAERMYWTSAVTGFVGLSATATGGSAPVVYRTANGGEEWQVKSATIDGDGAPNCYHPDGSPPGLDYLGNAGEPGNWWALATHNKKSSGNPVIQPASEVASVQPSPDSKVSQ